METTIYSPEDHPEITVVQTTGDVEFDACGSERLCGLLHGIIEGGDRFLVLDLSASEHVAERAIAEMVAVFARARLAGGDLVFVVSHGPVLKALRTIGVTELTLVLEYLDQAVDQMVLKAATPE